MEHSITKYLTLAALAITPLTSQAFQDVLPTDAYSMATTEQNTFILDVRTDAEWRWVGHPGVNGTGEGSEGTYNLDDQTVNISYKIFVKDNFVVNPSFISDIEDMFGDNKDIKIITMCRSGKRSVDAAAALEAAGYTSVYNMQTGFEGDKDANKYRTINGWKNDGLPYTASGTDEYDD